MFNRLFGFLAGLIMAAEFVSASPSLAAYHGTPGVSIVAKTSTDIPMFDTEAAAQAHCPSDIVVWLNTNSGIYHEKGMRWYGRTKHGAYVCRKEADAAGYRDTRNGQ